MANKEDKVMDSIAGIGQRQRVLDGTASHSIECGDCIEWLLSLSPNSVDLCFFSPPYEAARTYGIDFKLRGQAWVDWLVKVFYACQRACKGLVACVCEGQTRGFAYSAAPILLAADLHRQGFNLRKPPIFQRVGIPGSGGPDWLRNDYEFIICTTPTGKLPWSDNTACGHTPKWAPGGAMSYRDIDGERKNKKGRGKNGAANGYARGDTKQNGVYRPPAKANPGNVITCKVGGGLMGHDLAHENEAPFPLTLADFFVKSFCPPGGIALDCFSGSGTTAHSAVVNGRRFIGCDVRQAQVDIALKRLGSLPDPQPSLFE